MLKYAKFTQLKNFFSYAKIIPRVNSDCGMVCLYYRDKSGASTEYYKFVKIFGQLHKCYSLLSNANLISARLTCVKFALISLL